MQIVVNQLLTTYTQYGHGKKVAIMLHGWADSGISFEMLARQLIKDLPDFKFITLDLPGFGGTQAPSEAWGLEEYALFCRDFLKKLNIKPNLVIGHSNGGAIAIQGLACNFFGADKLVLIASAGIRERSIKKTAMRMAARPVGMVIKVAPKDLQRSFRQKVYSAIGSDYLIAEHMQQTFKKVVSQDMQAMAMQLKIPVSLIYGENDIAAPPRYGRIFEQKIDNSSLHIIPLSGHFVHQEQVPKVSRVIKEFVS